MSQVRVAFGDVWKESLTELSGGQKSLLALSLILALCRFKPAPIYILDEVDSALDLNHTQNIGRMIKVKPPLRVDCCYQAHRESAPCHHQIIINMKCSLMIVITSFTPA